MEDKTQTTPKKYPGPITLMFFPDLAGNIYKLVMMDDDERQRVIDAANDILLRNGQTFMACVVDDLAMMCLK